MTTFAHLTDGELIDQLTLRDDLTEIEHELLDRLIRANDAMTEMAKDVPACWHASKEGADGDNP